MPIVGIHLGSTYSAIALLDDHGQPAIVPVDGERIMASCVYAPRADEGSLVVGSLARNSLDHEPESIVKDFQRDMGTDKTYRLRSGLELTPVSASAAILRKLVQEAAKELGPINEVVITVPANFAERQRKATIEAGELAGLKVTNIINEPTAAVLAYAAQKSVKGTVLIYDLGGGTIDVTIAKVNGSEIECLTSEGDSALGGMDFDQKIADLIDQKHAEQYGRTLRAALDLNTEDDERKSAPWQSLLRKAEECKKTLSKMTSTPFIFVEGPDGPLRTEVTRQEFEKAISSLIAQTEMRVETALDSLNLSPEDIDDVLLVGGSSRVPAVKSSLKRLFGREPSEAVNLDEAVALGAAIYAGLRADQRSLKPMHRVNCHANYYYGMLPILHDNDVDEDGAIVRNIITKKTPIPCSKTETFYTKYANQQFVRIRVTQSADDESDPDFVSIIIDDQIGPLPAGRPSGQPIEIMFNCNLNQTMHVKFRDVKSGRTYEKTLELVDKVVSGISVADYRIKEMGNSSQLEKPRSQIIVPDFEIE
jgi:molecular chaperone DnaK